MTEAIELAERPAPIVHSTAQPHARALLLLRTVIQGNREMLDLFEAFRTEHASVDWLRDMVALRVAPLVSEDLPFDTVVEVCQYLADEYHQLGEGYFIVSRDTGRTVHVLSDEDLYDPGLLSRESGEVAQALLRINPALEGALISRYHVQGREDHVLRILEARSHPTELLRETGDRRLRLATRDGRRSVARELAEDDPRTLLRRAGGTTGMFLRHFELTDAYEGPFDCVEGVASCSTFLGIQDMTTLNLGYDRLGVLRGVTPQGWVRDIARQLSVGARSKRTPSPPLLAEDLSDEVIRSCELWIVDPDVFELMHRAHGRVMPVEGAEPLGLSGPAGYLVTAREFGVESREVADRWQVVTTVPYRLYVDWSRVVVLPLVGVARASLVEDRNHR